MANRTPQQIAAAAAKRAATQAANRAAGIPTVRQQRAAKRAAKAAAAGTSSTSSQSSSTQSSSSQSTPPPFTSSPFGRRRRSSTRRQRAFGTTPQPTAPIFAQVPNARALKLAALVALEAAFGAKLADISRTAPRDASGKPVLPSDLVDGWETYKKLKAHAIDPRHPSPAEAASALTIATVRLVKLAF
jgi:hypothetical protein